MIQEQIQSYFDVFGERCTKAGIAFRAVIDMPEEDFSVGMDGLRTLDAVLQVPANGAVQLEVGDVIQVRGAPHKVTRTRLIDDGEILEVGVLKQ